MTDDCSKRNGRVNMREHARTREVFTHQRSPQHGVIDFKQDESGFPGVIFLRGSRNLMLLGTVDKALRCQVSTCKRAIVLGTLPIGLFCNSINHALPSYGQVATL